MKIWTKGSRDSRVKTDLVSSRTKKRANEAVSKWAGGRLEEIWRCSHKPAFIMALSLVRTLNFTV